MLTTADFRGQIQGVMGSGRIIKTELLIESGVQCRRFIWARGNDEYQKMRDAGMTPTQPGGGAYFWGKVEDVEIWSHETC